MDATPKDFAERILRATQEFLSDAVIEKNPETGRLETTRANLRCDFCCQVGGIEWSYPAGLVDLSSLHNPAAGYSDTHWAACAACHALIEADDVAGLVERILAVQMEMAGMTVDQMPEAIRVDSRLALTEHIEKFKAARTGPALAEGEYNERTGEASA